MALEGLTPTLEHPLVGFGPMVGPLKVLGSPWGGLLRALLE